MQNTKAYKVYVFLFYVLLPIHNHTKLSISLKTNSYKPIFTFQFYHETFNLTLIKFFTGNERYLSQKLT